MSRFLKVVRLVHDLGAPAALNVTERAQRRLDAFSGWYIYPESLVGPDRWIRFIKILPSERCSDTIECRLDIVKLADNPDYEALSYQWGTSTGDRTIHVNNYPMLVTTNLEAALRQFRSVSDRETPYLWADAICINQRNVQEQNWQVTLMRDIYSNASNVRIWLGTADESSPLAFSLLRRIFGGEFDEERSHMAISDTDTSSEQRLAVLAEFFRNPYWSRRWIIQEIRLAKRRTLHCGWLALDFPVKEGLNKLAMYILANAVHFTAGAIKPGSQPVPSGQTIVSTAYALRDMADKIHIADTFRKDPDDPGTLLDLLYRAKYAQCLREHDIVYALLGLFPARLGMAVDYTQPVHDVFADFAYGCLEKFKTFDTFYEVRYPDSTVPSWVQELRPERYQWLGSIDANLYDACYSTHFYLNRLDQKTLQVKGLVIDTIKAVGSTRSTDHKVNVPIKLHTLLQKNIPTDWLSLYTAHCSSACSETTIEVLLRLFIADRYWGPQYWDPPNLFHRITGNELDNIRNGAELPPSCKDGKLLTFLATEGGRAGVGTLDCMQAGDRMVVIASVRLPFVLRPVGSAVRQEYRIIGPCYVHGELFKPNNGNSCRRRLTVQASWMARLYLKPQMATETELTKCLKTYCWSEDACLEKTTVLHAESSSRRQHASYH